MGWGSGVDVLDAVLDRVFARGIFSEDAKTYLAKDLIEVFMKEDCDTLDDSSYLDRKWFRRALYLAGWYQDDDGYGRGFCHVHCQVTHDGQCDECPSGEDEHDAAR